MSKLKQTRDTDQSNCFIEAARAAGASEDEAVFDANLKKIVKAKVASQVQAASDKTEQKRVK